MSPEMNLTDQIKQCRTPQEALLLLAAAIDELGELLAQPPADPWEQPLEWADTLDVQPGPPDNRAQIIDGEVVVKPVSQERQDARSAFFVNCNIDQFIPNLSHDDALDAYIKGGPRWLLYGVGRDIVMQMPVSYREALVADVLLDSHSEAAEISADILKFEFDEGARETDQIDFQRASRELGPAYKAHG